ncbi:unnamed protein product, partial [Choristocarpus tenellus]
MQLRDYCLVTCRLQNSTYLPGEQISGVITFALKDDVEDHVNLVKATVQAHGHVKVDPRWISLPDSVRNLYGQGPGQSFGENLPRYNSNVADANSACVFFTNAALVLKKERLTKEESLSFSFSLTLPLGLPPSFKVRRPGCCGSIQLWVNGHSNHDLCRTLWSVAHR